MVFRPLHETHAIERVSFALGIEREVTESELRLLAESYKELGHVFGRAELLEGLEISLRPDSLDGQPPAQINRSTVGGVRLKTFRPDGNIDWELATGKVIDATTVIINCYVYTRWDAVWSKARKIFSAALEKLKSPGVKWAGLEYLDVFVWQGEESDWRANQLFKEDNIFIPNAMMDKGPVWHTHLGWFTREGLQPSGHRLDILNIDGVRREGKLKMLVQSRMKHHFNRIHDAGEVTEENGGVYRSMEQMHNDDKILLDRLLIPEITKAMYLHAGDNA